MNKRRTIRVRDVMKSDFIMMEGINTVKEGINALLREDAHTLLIKKRNEDDEFGIIVLADIAKKILAVDKAPDRVNLYEIMSKPAHGVSPDLDIRYCARLFYRFGLSTAPVIENNEVLGVITYNEIVLHGLLENDAGL